MSNYTRYSPHSWKMKWVIPYLLKYYFENKPTSNKDLREAFYKLMSKDIPGPKGKILWSSKPTGVPSRIHRLVKMGIIIAIDESMSNREIEFEKDIYNYVLGPEAEKSIKDFTSKYEKSTIDEEIENYLDKKIKSVNDNESNEDIDNEDYLETKEEREMNNNFYYDFIETQGFYFSREILTRYFLSLRTKPFVILTGISGTGKTKIAQLFADYILQDKDSNEREKQFAFIPVRPDWMDNKGLFGYYNILDQKYYSTKFLQTIIDAFNNPDEPYFVILDEMNLSKVEMYFSDFLSIMETRTQGNEKGEAIPLHSLFSVDSVEGIEIPSKIHIPRNVFIAGTVNVDETTYMFSPKVLDRANVIEFNEVDLEGYAGLSPKKEDRFYLSNQDLKNELINPQEQPFCSRDDYLKVREILGNTNDPMDELLKILEKHTLHFGYRVVNEMSRFIWLSREYLGEQFDFNEAFDIQILQKILPKFHGTQAKLEQPLRDILAFCYSNKPIEFDNKFIEEASVSADEAQYVRTAKKLARMILNLQTQGYTSFIE